MIDAYYDRDPWADMDEPEACVVRGCTDDLFDADTGDFRPGVNEDLYVCAACDSAMTNLGLTLCGMCGHLKRLRCFSCEIDIAYFAFDDISFEPEYTPEETEEIVRRATSYEADRAYDAWRESRR